MKNIKILIFLLLVCSPLVLSSQTYDKYGREIKKIQLIARGGVNTSTVAIEDKNNEFFGEERSKTGYNFGIMTDIALGKNFYFQPNFSLSAKGSKMRDVEIENFGKADLSMNAIYIQVPVLFAYKFDLSRWQNSINIALGPYFAYGIGGKITGPIPESFDTFGKYGFCNRSDMGLNMEFNFEMPKLIFFLGYEYGFTKMIKEERVNQGSENRFSFHNSNNYIGIGYKF